MALHIASLISPGLIAFATISDSLTAHLPKDSVRLSSDLARNLSPVLCTPEHGPGGLDGLDNSTAYIWSTDDR